MNRTAVYLQGAIEPLHLDVPMNATALNMSAAMNNNMRFFQGKDTDGNDVVVAIPLILFMRDEEL